MNEPGNRKGKVYLVGAGPGRADLITVRGAELLAGADCVIYDKLANPSLLRYAGPDAEAIYVPKRTGPASFTQDQINELLIAKAREGKTVVRLKGGDPIVFGRGAEEAALLAEAGIEFEIVPGVTAAIAAGAYTGIMLTDRRHSSQLVLVTGREAENKQDSGIDWDLLAGFSGTIAFYMGMGNLEFITGQLLSNGRSADTPVAVIADATLPTQRTVRATLADVVSCCKESGIAPPAIIVIGPAARTDTAFDWFTRKPLFGKTIVVTRDARGNADFAARIIEQGGNPIEFATMKIKPLSGARGFLGALARLGEYDWVVFTSANGVSVFFNCLEQLGKDVRAFASAKVAAIGRITAARLRAFGIRADFVPTIFTSEQLGRQLARSVNLRNKRVLLLRSGLAGEQPTQILTTAGAKVENVSLYTLAACKEAPQPLRENLAARRVDWVTFASPFSASAFFEQIPVELIDSGDARIASVGPVTSKKLRELGVRVDVEAAEHTINGLVNAIMDTYQ